jgi:DNA repair exonuclease SbcCD ATPase subunit
MKLTALRLHNVKRFAGRGVAIENIGEGVNVLCAANEHGKSTCFEALHALFFQPHTGTSKGVQLLRPYSGGNPLVEVDIETREGRYRLTKQYYGGKRASVVDLNTGRLVAQADEAEAFIGALIRGGTAGPAGLLWVRQGITGIERRTNSEEESERSVRESLLTSVQGEVEALTGGRRMAEIAARCEEELFRLVTATLRPKAGGPYAAARDEHEKLLAEERRLATEVSALREALDKRRAARARLAELERPDEIAARREAIAAAQARHEAAKSHSEALRTAEAEAALAASRRQRAAETLDTYRAGLARAAALAERLNQAEAGLETARQRRSAAIAAGDAAVAEVELAERDQAETQSLLARLDAALAARAAAESLAELRARLAQAEAARQQVEDGEAVLATLAIKEKSVDQLRELEIELVRLRAAQAVTLPSVEMLYADPAAQAASLDGQPLRHGEPRNFTGSARIEIAGIGTLSLRSNQPPKGDQALADAQARHGALLASMGVVDLAAAVERMAAVRHKAAELELARQRLNDLAPKGLQHLHAELARLTGLSSGALELKGDPDAVRQHLARADAAVAAARNAVRETQPLRSAADDGLVSAQTAHAALAAELATTEAALGPVPGRTARLETLTREAERTAADHAAAEARAAGLRSAAHDLSGAEAALRRTQSVQEASDKEASQLRVTLADLNGAIHARADNAVEEEWQEKREQLAAAAERLQRYETEIAVLNRLRTALGAARSAARELYLKPVITELRPLLGLLFDDISIVFDETTLLPHKINRNGQDEDVDRLSGGMREQLSVLTRLAFARLLARDGRPAPVILDDALVYSDDDRIERMFDALHRQSRDQQILVFSCRQRAFARLGGNVLKLDDWTPGLQ